MKTRTWTALAICGIVFGFLAAPAEAGEEKGSGTVTYAPAAVDTVQLAAGSMVQRSHIMGIVLANDPSNFTPSCRHFAGLTPGLHEFSRVLTDMACRAVRLMPEWRVPRGCWACGFLPPICRRA